MIFDLALFHFGFFPLSNIPLLLNCIDNLIFIYISKEKKIEMQTKIKKKSSMELLLWEQLIHWNVFSFFLTHLIFHINGNEIYSMCAVAQTSSWKNVWPQMKHTQYTYYIYSSNNLKLFIHDICLLVFACLFTLIIRVVFLFIYLLFLWNWISFIGIQWKSRATHWTLVFVQVYYSWRWMFSSLISYLRISYVYSTI